LIISEYRIFLDSNLFHELIFSMLKLKMNLFRTLQKCLFGVSLVLIFISCQSSPKDFLSKEELNWLKQNDGKVEVLFGYQAPPSAYHKDNGEYVGFLVDYNKEIETYLGQKFVYRNFKTWDDLMAYAKTSRNFIIVGCAPSDSREEYLSFTNTIIKIPYVIIARKNSELSTMQALKNRKVCTPSQYAVNDYMARYFPEIKPIHYSDDIAGLRAVSTKACDATIANQMEATYIINEQGISNLEITGESGYLNRLSVAVSNNDPILFKIIDKTIDHIPHSRQQELYRKWVHTSPSKLSRSILITITLIAIIISALFAILWLLLKSLRDQVTKQTKQIRENEENLRITLNSIGDALIVTDIEGKITRMNPVAQKLTGWTFKEAHNKALEKVFRIINAKTGERAEDPVQKVLKSGKIIDLSKHTILKAKGGKQFQIADSAAPIMDSNSNISGVVLVFRDITEAYRMQTALEVNEARYRSLVENSNDAIYLLYEQQFEFINKRFEQMFGYKSEDLKRINFLDLVAPESLEFIKKRIEQIRNQDPLPSRFEFSGVSKSGEKLLLEVSASYIPFKEGFASQGIIRDITQNKKHELELIKAKENAEKSDRLKSAFLATMSHELRTPLNAVIGFSDLIQKDLPISEIIHFSEIINSSGKHLLDVIEDVFDISLIETGDIKIEKEPLNIFAVFDEVQDIIKNEQVLQKKIGVDLQMHINIEELDSILLSDQKRIKQILINLLKNALKFTNSGSIEFGCSRSTENKQSQIKFFVKDTGIGIPKAKQEIIFEAFRQADESHTRIHGGTGLGLTICKKLSKLLGGDIWVESEEGEGASFYFTIPLTENAIEHLDSTSVPPGMNFTNRTILIAEDDENSFSFLKALLSPEGISCIWVKDGLEAVEYCQKSNQIDLLLMDINMPKMNGYEATKHIREIHPKLPIIAQTAFAIAGDKEKIMASGCDDYISKPINKDDLFDKIQACFRKATI